ncbi:ArsA family ATPase [Halocatena halophila]|uniref:ArsA family ATPase n=1 Tax=Halocatena halophila TaxID=2814576 RepID=UPI002ED0DE77
MNQFLFIGGKGGVGKTTMATTAAIQRAMAGERTLVVSSDPAHSTSDLFEQPIGDDPTPIDGYDRLDAIEIDPDAAVEDHLQETKRALTDQVSPAIVNAIEPQLELAHDSAGAYEAALFDRVIDILQTARTYDRVVFDTAPTGGTLRLLALPDALETWIDRLLEKRTRSIELFESAAIGDRTPRRTRAGDPIVERLQERKDRFEFAATTLRSDTSFYLVVTPDELSIRETQRTSDRLSANGLCVAGLIVNKLTPEPDESERGAGAAFLRARRATERKHLDAIESIGPPIVATVQSQHKPPAGDQLEELSQAITLE